MVASDVRARVRLNIAADARTVFDAWIYPALMEQWLFKSPDNTLSARSDPQAGGSYSITEQAGGRIITHDGTYAWSIRRNGWRSAWSCRNISPASLISRSTSAKSPRDHVWIFWRAVRVRRTPSSYGKGCYPTSRWSRSRMTAADTIATLPDSQDSAAHKKTTSGKCPRWPRFREETRSKACLHDLAKGGTRSRTQAT